MGQGSIFDSALGTRGGRANIVTQDYIKSNDTLTKEILKEMRDEKIKFTKEKIVFIAKLKNGRKIFLEQGALDHIVKRHASQFKKTFEVTENEIGALLVKTISRGKLVKSYKHDSNGMEGYRNIYYYRGKYCIVYAIAQNGYIESAFPTEYKGDK